MTASRIAFLVWILVFVLGQAAPARHVQALEIEQVQWGYDGQVVPHRFNVLSVLVRNSSPRAFDGTLSLKKTLAAQTVDAPVVESLYLTPHSSRWVQLYPYVIRDWEEWTVSWGPSPAGEHAVPRPRFGKAASVLLEEPGAFPVGGGAIKRFPDNLFPPMVTATDCLSAVVLDHAPRWEEPRQKAFLAWLSRGGLVHVIQGDDGRFPEFPAALDVLNGEAAKRGVGSGYVFHHTRKRSALDSRFVQRVIVEGRDPTRVDEADAIGADEKPADEDGNSVSKTFRLFDWEGDGAFLTNLKKMAQPDHNWALLHLMSLAYIALIFPGCYAIGQKRAGDYRWTFGALGAIVLVFSAAFLIVGRRGYGETTAVHSVAIARPVGPDLYDVAQWSNAFVVEGGDYTYTHDAQGRMYSSCQDDERVRGEIHNGANAYFAADMPPFSARTMAHRGLVTAPTFDASIVELESGVEMRQRGSTLRYYSQSAEKSLPQTIIRRLVIKKGQHFPRNPERVVALYGRHIYDLSASGDRLTMSRELGDVEAFVNPEGYDQMAMMRSRFDAEVRSREKLFLQLLEPLVARSLDLADDRETQKFALPTDRVRLFVYAPMPEELFLKNDRFGTQRGYVLYCLDVFPGSAETDK